MVAEGVDVGRAVVGGVDVHAERALALVDDLRSGWDTRVAFALAHPTVCRLIY